MAVLWWLWKWRNDFIFNDIDVNLQGKLLHLSKIWSDIDIAFANDKKNPSFKSLSFFKWVPPPLGCWTLNTDGACRGNQQLTGGGGLFWDQVGIWQHVFVCNTGSCDFISAELWVVRYGLQPTCDKGCRSFILEIDSKDVLRLLLDNNGKVQFQSNVIFLCRELLQRD